MMEIVLKLALTLASIIFITGISCCLLSTVVSNFRASDRLEDIGLLFLTAAILLLSIIGFVTLIIQIWG